MSQRVRIALDAMGGDHGPDVVVAGAELALARHPEMELLFFGNAALVTPLVARYPALKSASRITHAEFAVRMDDKPSQALRYGRRKSSMWLAIEAVRKREADIAVSAGNTGALMALAKFALKTLPGIDRPAIAGFFPTRRGESVMLDLGANVECDAENLVQFALMGEVFARTVLGLSKPSVALLNIGSEELKGNDAVRGAALRLRAP